MALFRAETNSNNAHECPPPRKSLVKGERFIRSEGRPECWFNSCLMAVLNQCWTQWLQLQMVSHETHECTVGLIEKQQTHTRTHDTWYELILPVGELIVSKFVVVSINNWLQDVSATKAFVSCVQTENHATYAYEHMDLYTVLYTADEGLHGRNVLQSVVNWYCYEIAHNQFAYVHWRA